MQTLIDATGPFALPTGWHEVTTKQFCAVDPLTTVEQRASYFAGRPIQVNGLVADALAWMLQAPPTDGGLPFPSDLGQETYLQVETIRALLAKQSLHQCYGEVYGVLVMQALTTRPDGVFRQAEASQIAALCPGWPILDTYPAVAHCLTELERLSLKYAELSEPDPTEAGRRARDAGADELLGMFTHFNVAKALAEREGCSVDVIYQKPWETVAITLLHDRRSAILCDTIQRNSKHHE